MMTRQESEHAVAVVVGLRRAEADGFGTLTIAEARLLVSMFQAEWDKYPCYPIRESTEGTTAAMLEARGLIFRPKASEPHTFLTTARGGLCALGILSGLERPARTAPSAIGTAAADPTA
jgi:hypothetical protein